MYVFTTLIDRRLEDIEPVDFQQTFFAEEHSIIRTAVISVKCVTIKPLEKLSDLNHSRNILYKRLLVLRNAKFRGTTVLNAKVCHCFFKAYGWRIKQSLGNPEGARLQILNSIDHYFGNHSGCLDYQIEDEHGKMVTCYGFYSVGPHYEHKYLKNSKALDQVFTKKIRKVRGHSAPDPAYEEIQIKEEIFNLFQPFIERKFLEQVTSGNYEPE